MTPIKRIVTESRKAMPHFETTSLTVPYRQRCEDVVKVLEFDEGVVLIVADGAGGSGGGLQAAKSVVEQIKAVAQLDFTVDQWCQLLRQVDFRIPVGEATCVVVSVTKMAINGASVGDSQAWLFNTEGLIDLTANQNRKPLLGTGEAVPVGFTNGPLDGTLLVATDGLCNYVKRDQLQKEILWIEFPVLARKLVEMVRLPSGDLWDDVGLIACRRMRSQRRRRHTITD